MCGSKGDLTPEPGGGAGLVDQGCLQEETLYLTSHLAQPVGERKCVVSKREPHLHCDRDEGQPSLELRGYIQ